MADDDNRNQVGEVVVGLTTAKVALGLIGRMAALGALGGAIIGAATGGLGFIPVLEGAAIGGAGLGALGGAVSAFRESQNCVTCGQSAASRETSEASLSDPVPDLVTTRHRERVAVNDAGSSLVQGR